MSGMQLKVHLTNKKFTNLNIAEVVAYVLCTFLSVSDIAKDRWKKAFQ